MASPVLQFKRGNIGVAATIPALRPGEPAFTLDKFDLFVGLDTSVAGNKFFGSHRYWGREDTSTSLRLKLVDKDGTNYVAIKSPDTLAGIVTYQLPGTQGGNGTVLKNDGNGNLSWGDSVDYTGINTFTNTTDNTLGNPDTGAVQIDGGLGVNKNVTIGAGLSVAGQSYFIGTATFYGGTINLGNEDTDDIVVAGEFKSNLIPSDDATYNLGTGAKRWNNASFAGIGTFATGLVADNVRLGIGGNGVVDTTSGPLYLDSASGTTIINDHLDLLGDLDVQGNVYIGGTTVTLRGEEVFIENKDIVLGYTTSVTPNDTTANHAGVAIASTEGTPLSSFAASGINTLPDTYKQMMWFKSGTLGFATDVFAFNYGVAIGTTTMANGVRLAVGSGITMSDTSISATNFYGALIGNASSSDQVKTVTASNTNANYHITFVDANNGSATNETVYTDDGIYYNPGANKLTTQHAEFTGNVLVSGITTLAGNVFLGDSGSDLITVVGVTTFTTSNVYIDNQLYVGGLQITGGAVIGQDITTRNLLVSGISTIGDSSSDTLTVNATATFVEPIVGTIGTATRATLVDTTGTSTNADYYVTFVDTLAGQTSETLRVGAGLSVNPSNGEVKTQGILSVGNPAALTSYIKAGGGSNALYMYGNGDVSFQAKAIVNEIRSSSNATTLITLSGLDASFANNVNITGITTVGSDLIVVGDVRINGNDIKASDGNTNITLTSNTLTEIKGDLQVTGNDIKSSTGNTAISLSDTSVTIAGDLYVSGNTTQVNTTTLTVEDTLVELGLVNGSAPGSDLDKDLGLLLNYYSGSAKKAAMFWDDSASRIVFADDVTESSGVLTVASNAYASIEIESLWVNDCAGQSQVITCSGTERFLQNITVDAGTF